MANLGSRIRIFLLVFLVTAFLLATNGVFLYRNVEALESHQLWVTHTFKVISELDLVISSLKEAETNQRGYLLKRQTKFLDQYRDSTKSVWTHMQTVKTLTVDNESQQKQWAQLEESVRTRLRFLQETLEKYQAAGGVTDSFLLGQESMEVVRRQADFMISQEDALLKERVASTAKQRSFLVFSLFGSTLFSILVAFATYLLIRRQTIAQSEEEARRTRENWVKTAEADAALISLKTGGVRAIAEGLAKYVCERADGLAANLYLENDGSLTLAAGYLMNGDKNLRLETARRKSFKLGEGLLGRAALQDGLQIVSEIPSDYFKIESSMGERTPNSLILVPVTFQDERVGVLEIASFKTPSPEQIELLGIVVRASAAGISKGRAQERQQLLLEETQRQAEELQMQQEELRTTNEELEEQAKALTEAQARSQLQTEELRQINEELEQQARTLEAQQETLSVKNSALETSRRALEDKAKEIERTSAYKSEFMAKMSHELRTPLNSLMILATILQENKKGNLDIQQVEFAKTIYEAGTDLLDLINDILDLSKIEAKKLQVKPEVVIIRQFLDQISALFVPQAEARGLKLRVEVDTAVPERFKTDRQRLQQILRNLIGNAMKFTETGTITLHAELINDRVAISVQDTGIGIPPEKIRVIWEAFEQADGSISRRFGGTGLGLTISRELTTLLQGDIGATSESGKGSRFTVQLPLELHADQNGMPVQGEGHTPRSMTAPPVIPPPPPVERSASEIADDKNERSKLVDTILSNYQIGDRTILVVEDDLKFQASVAEAVRMQSFKPLLVNDGETALELLKRHTPHAILLDIHLPGINGLALLDVIKKNPSWRGVPIHMISALERQQSALRMGAIGYLGKPVTIDGVRGALNRIESVLERKVKRLLVVEDDSRQRGLISELLSGADVEIQAIGTGHEALEILKKQGADCVVLDLKLPDMTGFELLESLDNERGLSLPPVIVYTGKDLTREEEDRLRRYSDSIIIKGAKSPERLLDEVSLFIHRIEADMPQDKRAMLTNVRGRDRNFDGRSLLIVDDDLRNLFALTSALEGKGFDISVARDGIEALEKLEMGPKPDLVLMDIMMPRMDGFEAMKRIRMNPKLRDLPIVALTAKAMAGEHERCVQAGASDYLPKPIDLSNLLSVLKVWLPAEGIMS